MHVNANIYILFITQSNTTTTNITTKLNEKKYILRYKICNVKLRNSSIVYMIFNTVYRIMRNYLDYSKDPHATVIYMNIIKLHYISEHACFV